MCGIGAVIGSLDPGKAAVELHQGNLHRGQDGVGAASFDTFGKLSTFHSPGNSRIHTEWQVKIPDATKGARAVLIHGRYPTTQDQEPSLANTQPLTLETRFGTVVLVHNGNLVDQDRLRKDLCAQGVQFKGTSDSEILLHLIDQAPVVGSDNPMKDAVTYALKEARGSYACLIMFKDRLYAACDPQAIQPLVMYLGEKHLYFASEDSALPIQGEKNRAIIHLDQADLVEVLFQDRGPVVNGPEKFLPTEELPRKAHCSFNYVYLAKHTSNLWGRSVEELREKFGMALYAKVASDWQEYDAIAQVPKTALPMLRGLLKHIQIPELELLEKLSLGERTFMNLGASGGIESQAEVFRANLEKGHSARDKYNILANPEQLAGKSLIVIDDSFVRGTTAKDLLITLEHYQVKRVLFLSASPTITEICDKGVYISSRAELLARGKSEELLTEEAMAARVKREAKVTNIEVDIRFLSLHDFMDCFGSMSEEMCYACMGGYNPLAPRH